MSTQSNIIPFIQQAAMPAALAAAFGDESNVATRETMPQLTFRGKVWRIVMEGEEHPMLNKEDEPISTVRVVILDFNRDRARAFYEGQYVEGQNQAPACRSSDGRTPDKDVAEPVASTCAACSMSAKGSRATASNPNGVACSTYKNLAVIPYAKVSMEPLRLRIPQTSMWDKNNSENEAKGWYAFDQYIDFIRARGAVHTAAIITKVKFDPNVAYPKLLFSPEGYIEEPKVEAIRAAMKHESIDTLLGRRPEAASEAGKALEEKPAAKRTPVPALDAEEPVKTPAKAKPKAAPVEVEEDDEAAPIATKPKRAPVTVDEEGEEAAPVKAVKAAPAKTKPAPVVDEDAPTSTAAVASLLDDWDD